MSILRKIYHRLLSEESRFWLYKQRHRKNFAVLRSRVNHHEKAAFSLCGYTEKQAIFVHITKAAGTSVALSLFGYLPYHYTAMQYRVIFGKKEFNRYFKFTFVRNPWDRLYSAYTYLKSGGWDENDKVWAGKNLAGITDFNQFVMDWLTPEKLTSHIHFWPQSKFIYDAKGRLLIDYLGYFETIEDDFSYVAKKINPVSSLAHTNMSKRGSYKDAYTPEAQRKVAALYETDIRNFGYSFSSFQRKRVQNSTLVEDGLM